MESASLNQGEHRMTMAVLWPTWSGKWRANEKKDEDGIDGMTE